MTRRRLVNSTAGFFAGILTAPLAVVLWTFFVALMAWIETDDEDDCVEVTMATEGGGA